MFLHYRRIIRRSVKFFQALCLPLFLHSSFALITFLYYDKLLHNYIHIKNNLYKEEIYEENFILLYSRSL